jgi:hypothetical protein
LRRAEIASNLPVVDAEVERAQKQLADLRAEVARIEAAVQKGLDNKRRLAEEMEKLSQEADEQLQAQKEKLNELKLEEAGEGKGMSLCRPMFASFHYLYSDILFPPVTPRRDEIYSQFLSSIRPGQRQSCNQQS